MSGVNKRYFLCWVFTINYRTDPQINMRRTTSIAFSPFNGVFVILVLMMVTSSVNCSQFGGLQQPLALQLSRGGAAIGTSQTESKTSSTYYLTIIPSCERSANIQTNYLISLTKTRMACSPSMKYTKLCSSFLSRSIAKLPSHHRQKKQREYSSKRQT